MIVEAYETQMGWDYPASACASRTTLRLFVLLPR